MTVPIEKLKPNPRNPRVIKDDKFRQLVRSIQDFPQMLKLRPLVVDEDYVVLGGNMRLRALQELGHTKVEIKIAEGLSEDQKQEFVVKDNVPFGEWDWEALAEWDQSKLQEWGMELPDFDKTKEAKEDDYSLPDKITTDIKVGDLFQIGRHFLLCGDSRKATSWKALMNRAKADLVIEDPPYGVSYTGGQNATAKDWTMIKNDDLRGQALTTFLTEIFRQAAAHAKPAAAFYVWYASRNHMQFETALINAGLEVRQQLIWNKGMVLGHSDYHWAHEPVLYCRRTGESPVWYGDRSQKTILGLKRTDLAAMKKEDLIKLVGNLQEASTNWEVDRDSLVTYKHPTQKPVPLIGRAINNSCPPEGIVTDPCGGSGVTMVAAEQLDRTSYLMDLDPQYCQVIIDRMRNLVPDIKIVKL